MSQILPLETGSNVPNVLMTDSLNAQLSLDKARATAEGRVDLEKLTDQVSLLKQQVQLLQVQKELKGLQEAK